MTWNNMDNAPRDGTVIEIECRYGVKPWRALVSWGDGGHGYPLNFYKTDTSQSPHFLETCRWRSWAGDPAKFKDPYRDIDDFDYYLGKRPSRPRRTFMQWLTGAPLCEL